jgi:acyl carrier protein
MAELVAARVVREVRRIAGPSRTPADAGPDTPLTEGGFELDSVEILELIVATELAFDIEIDPTALLPAEALRDPRGLALVVEAALVGRAGQPQ